MDIDKVYLVLIIIMGIYTTTGIARKVGGEDELTTAWSSTTGGAIAIPALIYFMQYYWGIQNYNTKIFMIGILTVIYIFVLISQYIMENKKSNTTECGLWVSSNAFTDPGDIIYRFVYGAVMIIIPMILMKSNLIFLWLI